MRLMTRLVMTVGLLVPITFCGCVSKSTMQARERAAFLAGQSRVQTEHEDGPVVTIVGPVKYHLVQWTKELTVAHAILQAEYMEKSDPRSITLIRNGSRIPIDPRALLAGQDFPLLSGDVLLIQP